MPDRVQGLWYFAAAIGYAVVVLLANRYYGLAGAAIAVAACLVVQFGIIEPAERRRRRRGARLRGNDRVNGVTRRRFRGSPARGER